MEAQAQYNKDCVSSLPSLQQGAMMWVQHLCQWTGPICAEPTYLGIKLYRALTFCLHLESLHKKLTSHVGLLQWLAGTSWGADATVFCTAILALVHFTAEYGVPVWCCSAHTHLINKPINDALRIVTKCLHPTPTDNLFILSGIQPIELCYQKVILSLVCCTQAPEPLQYERLLSPLGGQLQQLKLRNTFVPASLELLNDRTQSGTNIAQ